MQKILPINEEYKEIYFNHFVAEIKLLHLLYHRNIVRVFNYYLYPEKMTGYILMEFIDGTDINNYIKENPELLDQIFIQTINGFKHLEETGILHRDIRPENIMVSHEGIVKIIDFGFGKKVEFENDYNNSVSLNWRYSTPKDFEHEIYDLRTEVYFVGKLFEEIIQENDLQNFSYSNVLLNMIHFDYNKRTNSFFEVDRKLIDTNTIEINFSKEEIEVYQNFANEVQALFSQIAFGAEYSRDLEGIISSLENCYRNSILENYVQNPNVIARTFVKGQYYYNNRPNIIDVNSLKKFLQLLNSVSIDKKRIVINNLWQRLDSIKRYHDSSDEDDLPF